MGTKSSPYNLLGDEGLGFGGSGLVTDTEGSSWVLDKSYVEGWFFAKSCFVEYKGVVRVVGFPDHSCFPGVQSSGRAHHGQQLMQLTPYLTLHFDSDPVSMGKDLSGIFALFYIILSFKKMPLELPGDWKYKICMEQGL